MNTKKVSNISEPTTAEMTRRFIRRNSYCSLECRSRSSRRHSRDRESQQAEVEQPRNTQLVAMPQKMQTESMKVSRPSTKGVELARRQCSGSLKMVQKDLSQIKVLNEAATESCQTDEVKVLKCQYKKLKVYFNEQRQKRRSLEEEVRLSRQEIKRLEKRLDKYKSDKLKLTDEKEAMLEHIQILEGAQMGEAEKKIQGYRLTYLSGELQRLKGQLERGRSGRERELLGQIEKLMQQKYVLEKQVNSATVARCGVIRQLQQMCIQLQQTRVAVQQKVTRSSEYIELRQRYRLLLTECKWLRQQIDHLQRINSSTSPPSLSNTLLTLSLDSVHVE